MVSLLQRFPQSRGHSILFYHTGTQNGVLITEVFSIQWSLNTILFHWNTEWCPYYRGFLNSGVTQYYFIPLGHRMVSLLQRFPQFRGHSILFYSTGTQNGVLITEVSSIQWSLNTILLHWHTEWCPYYGGFLNSEVTQYYFITLGHRMVSLLQRFPNLTGKPIANGYYKGTQNTKQKYKTATKEQEI